MCGTLPSIRDWCTDPIAAIVFGAVANGQITESNGNERGHGLANWGIGLGLVELVGIVVVIAALAHGSQSPCDPSGLC